MTLLTVRAAADRLGVGYSTLKRWVHSGLVRTTRTEGGHHRVSSSEIERLLAKQQPESRGHQRPVAGVDESIAGLSARNRLYGFIEEVRVDGLLALKGVIVQDEATSVVWETAGLVARAGLADAVLPLDAIATELTRRTARSAAAGDRGAA